jgi:mRNA interferase HigB
MRIIAKRTLQSFWENSEYRDAEQPLKAWYLDAKNSKWLTPADIKKKYRSVSFLANNRAIFNIHGNKYRLVVRINYKVQIVYIRFIGTHKQYDFIDAGEV